jgi:hypothetical protein
MVAAIVRYLDEQAAASDRCGRLWHMAMAVVELCAREPEADIIREHLELAGIGKAAPRPSELLRSARLRIFATAASVGLLSMDEVTGRGKPEPLVVGRPLVVPKSELQDVGAACPSCGRVPLRGFCLACGIQVSQPKADDPNLASEPARFMATLASLRGELENLVDLWRGYRPLIGTTSENRVVEADTFGRCADEVEEVLGHLAEWLGEKRCVKCGKTIAEPQLDGDERCAGCADVEGE